MWLMDDQKAVERIELFDSFGEVKYTIRFSNFHQQGDQILPFGIQILGNAGTGMSLSVETFQSGIPLPERAFELDLSQAKVVILDS
jgi:hypothetical protein